MWEERGGKSMGQMVDTDTGKAAATRYRWNDTRLLRGNPGARAEDAWRRDEPRMGVVVGQASARRASGVDVANQGSLKGDRRGVD